MSEKELKQRDQAERTSKLRKLAAGLGLAAVVAGGGVAAGHELGSTPKPNTTEVATQQITTNLALEHSVNVLDGGTAVVENEDGSQINIESPIMTGDGTVAERSRGSDAGELTAVTAYSPGENGVTSVTYFNTKAGLNSDGGASVSETFATTHPMQLKRADGLSGNGLPDQKGENNFVPLQGTGAPAETIAKGTVYLPHQ